MMSKIFRAIWWIVKAPFRYILIPLVVGIFKALGQAFGGKSGMTDVS